MRLHTHSVTAPLSADDILIDTFSDEELTPATNAQQPLPYALQHAHRLFRAVQCEGPNSGFIGETLWRPPADQTLHNSRVMENVLGLVFLYRTDRPWNLYRGQPQLRNLLGLSLARWLDMADESGRFCEYEPEDRGLSPTAFACKFLSRSVELLLGDPYFDRLWIERIERVLHRAITTVLTEAAFYEQATRVTNQFGNVWGPAFAWIRQHPDDLNIARVLDEKLDRSVVDFHSPCGYPYEGDGPDWAYTLDTHESNIEAAWPLVKGTRHEPHFVEEEKSWAEWLGYNAVIEPNGSGFVLNRAVATRRQLGFFERLDSPVAEKSLPHRAFAHTRDEIRERCEQWRSMFRKNAGVPYDDSPMALGGYRPYMFLRIPGNTWYPDVTQREKARANLPYLSRASFTHQRCDSRHPVAYTFIRRPGYYACFRSGPTLTEITRNGLGLLWVPGFGCFVQSQQRPGNEAWGTRMGNAKDVFESNPINAEYLCAGRAIQPACGCHDLPSDAPFSITYALGDNGTKSIRFLDHAIQILIQLAGHGIEQIPLLLREDDVVESSESGSLHVHRGGTELHLKTGTAASLSLQESPTRVGPYRVSLLSIAFRGSLKLNLGIGSGL